MAELSPTFPSLVTIARQIWMSGVPTVGEVIEIRSDELAEVESCSRAVASEKASTWYEPH